MEMDVEALKKMDHKTKIRIGLIMGIFCALYWGVWYVPGYAVWNMNILTSLNTNISDAGFGVDTTTVSVAIFLTGMNAIFCAIVLFIWNGALGKLPEFKRETIQFKGASKYFLMAGLCGACAVSGTYLASSYLSPGFAAIAGLLYPIIGTTLSVLVLKQKVSKRAYLGITVILIGGITLYAGTLAVKGADGSIIGFIGGIMAAVGWGCEGAVAGKALDTCEPDVGLHLRFCFEALFWIVVFIVLYAAGIPIFSTIGDILDPATLFVFILLGLSFAWCYVSWYKSFPFLGVPRGQAIGSLYAACAIIFLTIFAGPASGLGYAGFEDQMWIIVASTIAGLLICLVGSYLLGSEDTEGLVSLREES